MAKMNRDEQNKFLTHTSAGTPMGALFRRYWLPALLSEELPIADGPPVRVELLSEKLLAFRDSSGRLGLIDEFCAHRGPSLWFGRNEHNGIRCPYHGWKYDVNGRCLEIPSEKPGSNVCDQVALKSYPLIERGGVIWAYLGPKELQPEFPEYEFALVPDAQRYISKRWQDCNYLQALEGGVDPNHVAFLHSGELNHEVSIATDHAAQHWKQELEVRLESEVSEGGLIIAYGRQSGGNDKYYWRIQHFLLPNFTLIPPFSDHPIHGHFWVPINDHQCFAWTFDFHPKRALTASEVAAFKQGKGLHAKVIPGTYLPVASKANNYLIDREKQNMGRYYSGVEGIAMADAAIQESMGSIQDRSKEFLVSSDKIIVSVRRLLINAATELDATDVVPGTSNSSQRVRSAAAVLPTSVPVINAVKAALSMDGGEYMTH